MPLPPGPDELAEATLGDDPTRPPATPGQILHVHPREIAVAANMPPPIALPDAGADVEVFDQAVRKRVVAALMDPRTYESIIQGLTAPDLRERRLWVAMLLGTVGNKKEGSESGTSVRIIMNQAVPGPQHEEGPLVRQRQTAAIEVTAAPPADPDRE